jgi:hypothetical protein
MTKLVQNRKNTLITYSVLNLLLCLLSLFLLFFKIFEVSFVLFVSTIFDFFYLFVIISFGKHKTADNKALDSGKNLVVFTILRSIIEVASLAICALGVFLIPSLNSGDTYQKLKYLFILAGLVPYFSAILLFYLNSKCEEGN